MRAFEAIKKDIAESLAVNDAAALRSLSQEMESIGTAQATAAANRAAGIACVLTGAYAVALDHLQRAHALYAELDDRLGLATVAGDIGTVHFRIGDYPVALDHCSRARTLHEELNNHVGMAGAMGNIGAVLTNMGDLPSALELFHRALDLHTELGNRTGEARMLANIGVVHYQTGDYPEALAYYHRALALHDELGDRGGVASIHDNIGSVYNSIGDHASALEHHRHALRMHQELHDRGAIASVTGNLARVYADMGDHTAALEHCHRALAMHDELGQRGQVARVTCSILTVLFDMGSHSEVPAYVQALDEMQIDEPIVRVAREYCRARFLASTGDVDAAVVTQLRALTMAQEHGLRSQAAEIHSMLRDLALKRNDLAGYVEHNNAYQQITQEINGKDTATKLAMQAKQREIDAREREHAQYKAALHATLPAHIAERVVRGETVNDHFTDAAILFIDIVGFTEHTSNMHTADVVALLERVFTTIDAICDRHNVAKIKTIGDSYMCFRGDADAATNAQSVANVGLDIMTCEFTWPDGTALKFRSGIHTGPVAAGVIGTQRLQYDVWGDTVNVASRMESAGEPGHIHVSEAFATVLRSASNTAPYTLTPRGMVEIKGKGAMQTWWLEP